MTDRSVKVFTMTDKESSSSCTYRPGADAAERILCAAETLFSQHGFDGVSMNAIAERAGVSKANVFHHFNSKDALYLAVIKNCCGKNAALQGIISGPAPLHECLPRFAESHLATILEQEHVSRLIARELLKDQPERAEELAQQIFGEDFARFVDILRQRQAAGELRKEIDPAMVAVLLIAADVFFFEARPVLQHFPDVKFAQQPARYSGMLVDILLRGILADKPEQIEQPVSRDP
jgi:TetR/AcrR family transcriptional regulator